MLEAGCSGLVHWDDPEGWDGEGGGKGVSGWGTHVHPWLIHVNVWQNQYKKNKIIAEYSYKKKLKVKCSNSTSVYLLPKLKSVSQREKINK